MKHSRVGNNRYRPRAWKGGTRAARTAGAVRHVRVTRAAAQRAVAACARISPAQSLQRPERFLLRLICATFSRRRRPRLCRATSLPRWPAWRRPAAPQRRCSARPRRRRSTARRAKSARFALRCAARRALASTHLLGRGGAHHGVLARGQALADLARAPAVSPFRRNRINKVRVKRLSAPSFGPARTRSPALVSVQ